MAFNPRPEYTYEDTANVPLIQTTLRYTAGGSTEFNDMQLEPLSFVARAGDTQLMGLAPVVERPRSTGRLRITSADPAASPAIECNLLDDKWDVKRMVEGVHIAFRALQTSALRDLVDDVKWPSPPHLESDEALATWTKRAAASGYHPCGTAAMGHEDDEMAVCDQYGRVYGTTGMIVADASIMPNVPRANTNIPTIMIGERFGEWLREGLPALTASSVG